MKFKNKDSLNYDLNDLAAAQALIDLKGNKLLIFHSLIFIFHQFFL
jgi:hypothetical protein